MRDKGGRARGWGRGGGAERGASGEGKKGERGGGGGPPRPESNNLLAPPPASPLSASPLSLRRLGGARLRQARGHGRLDAGHELGLQGRPDAPQAAGASLPAVSALRVHGHLGAERAQAARKLRVGDDAGDGPRPAQGRGGVGVVIVLAAPTLVRRRLPRALDPQVDGGAAVLQAGGAVDVGWPDQGEGRGGGGQAGVGCVGVWVGFGWGFLPY